MATKDEMDALEKNKSWVLVQLPKDRKVVGRKWVYKLKKGISGNVERYKTRLVAKVYSQMEGILEVQVKWVLWYFTGTSDDWNPFNSRNDSVCGYFDSDFVGVLDKRRSTLGYVFTLAVGSIS